ncbi:MAG TPA: SRPBCC family protein [Gemmatimonadales bacterium]|nr:SRPBCC family protein [Gemmatimonadales bacterium]
MLKTIAIVVALALAAVLVSAAFQPDSFRVQRATTIAAPPERVFGLIDDFHKWGAWSPWEKMDPAMKRTFSGADRGPGAVYEWLGNSKVGQGRMEIIEAPAPSKVAIKLDFLEPFEAHNVATFSLTPEDGATRVTWTMDGPSPYVTKVMHLFFNMDRMVGKDFEAGLANLKAVAER